MRERVRGGIAGAAAAAVALALALPAVAADGGVVVRLTVAGGSLALDAPRVLLTDRAPATVTVTVADARGSGAGWTLDLRAARPVSVVSAVVSCAPGSTCSLPAHLPGTPILPLRAGRGAGMGIVCVRLTLAPLAAGTPPTAVAFRLE